MIKRTKIVATVGPASGSRDKLRALVEAGVDVFRINFSHGDEAQRGKFLQHIRAVEHDVGWPVAICGDPCGPKVRVGMIPGQSTGTRVSGGPRDRARRSSHRCRWRYETTDCGRDELTDDSKVQPSYRQHARRSHR
jgi:pyruvate kinase